MTTASAAGKAILLGEHAVVYGRPAIAVPVSGVRAEVTVVSLPAGRGIYIVAEDLGQAFALDQEQAVPDAAHALQATVRHTLSYLELAGDALDLRFTIRSQIPVARGLGSGTAVAAAMVRALSQHLGQPLSDAEVSDLVFQTEILLHGTPSGIDNTVVAYEQPVYFKKGHSPAILAVGRVFALVIADTGIAARTRDTVAGVRRRWLDDPQRYEALFDGIAATVDAARAHVAEGDLVALGALMSENHRLLVALGVSCAELDHLVEVAHSAGALGAKLSGGGGGGCMIALADQDRAGAIGQALAEAGAVSVLRTLVQAGG